MFCPNCHSEFRPGFTRCGTCNVDLVDTLDESAPGERAAPERMPPMLVSMTEVCGYLDFDDARSDRDLLHREGILTELVIRISPEAAPGDPIVEEYWLRAEAAQKRRVDQLLERRAAPQHEPQGGDGTFRCSNCDRPVREEETFCANCGLRFEG